MPTEVLRLRDFEPDTLAAVLDRFALRLVIGAAGDPIPGSFWGGAEAGLIGDRLHARGDTPLHSILHETGHYVCMDGSRRARLDTDAGSDDAEESAVCYLQILLSDSVPGCNRARLLRDMDAWGYSFRLGSSRAWFENDADDALKWLICNDIIDQRQRPRWRLRS